MFAFTVLAVCVTACLGAVPIPFIQDYDERIVGGLPANITNFPYQVAMELHLPFFDGLNCGGSIISADWVVLAAHCVKGSIPSEVTIRAGTSFVGTGGSVHSVSEIISHPDYKDKDYDIALIKVLEPFIFSESIQKIPLTSQTPPAGTSVVVSGWGTLSSDGPWPSQLQQVEINIVDFDDCTKIYEPIHVITPRMICAGVPEGGKDSCEGDSGGPVVSEGKLVGIVSWAYGCAARGYPGVNADVAVLRSWIESHTGVLN
ncbi:trypsin-1-like [Periplaneta americana]|uniref:trypsin-1-like n=1 Tax=Periplaneta americana TaxID=6978 RepID=UPI0037E71997